MNNELVRQDSFTDLMNMAKTFAESGMFENTKQAAQCFVKIQAGQELGIPPFASMNGIHIISGKPTIGAGLIASKIKGSGKYDYEVMQQDDSACSIDFYQGKKKIGNSIFTIEDAGKAGTKNLDKFPRNMLFARAISNGVKWFCPDVFTGPVYVPEEMQDIEHEVVKTTMTLTQADPVQPQLTDNDTLYRTPTSDVGTILELIESATDPKLLKTFRAVNAKAFAQYPELLEKLKERGMELSQPKDQQQAA